MSREKVELVERLYELLLSDTPQTAFDLLDPKIEWETSPNLPDAGVLRGRDRIMRFLAEQWETVWGGVPLIEVERTFHAGHDVVAFVRARGRGSQGGVPLDVRIAHVFTVRDGRIVRGRVFPNRAEALEAVGLRE